MDMWQPMSGKKSTIKDKVDKGNPKANKDWTCGKWEDSSLDPTGLGGKKRERERKREKEREFRERGSTFSLDFSVIGPSNLGETRGKVDPHYKSYTWVPVLWSFGNSRR